MEVRNIVEEKYSSLLDVVVAAVVVTKSLCDEVEETFVASHALPDK